MRLLLDEHHDPWVAERLRHLGHDVVAVTERDDLRGRPDEEVFAVAADERRAIVTENARDYIPLAKAWAASDIHHSGVIVTRPGRHPRGHAFRQRLADALAALLGDNVSDDALDDVVIWL